MADFTQGLMAGFSFVDNLRARAQDEALQKERIGLARAAESRAQSQFGMDVADRDIRLQRQASTDESNRILARIQQNGVEGLSPEEQAKAQELSAFNPGIGTALQEYADRQRDADAIMNLRGPNTLGNVATSTQGAQTPQVTQSPGDSVAPGMVTPEQFVADPGGTGMPAAQSHGIINRRRDHVERLLGIPLPDAPAAGRDPTIISVPEDFYQRVQQARQLPAVEQEQAMKSLREEATGLSQAVDFERQAAAVAESDITAWQDFVDPDNRGGSALRDMAATSPSLITNKLHQDWTRIEKDNPNLLGIISREMYPVMQESLNKTRAAISQLPVTANGLVDSTTPEAKRLKRDFENALDLQQRMSDQWKPELEAQIRAGSMPIGNPELAANVAATVANTAPPGMPATGAQARAQMTLAQRAVSNVGAGTSRTLTTKAVGSLAWLAKRGYITPGGFENFLATGSFADPADIEFINWDGKTPLIRASSNGSYDIIPPLDNALALDRNKEMFESPQYDFIRNQFVIGNDPKDVARGTNQMNQFMMTLRDNAASLGLQGIESPADIRTMPLERLARAVEIYQAYVYTGNEWEDSWRSLNWLPGFLHGGDNKFENQIDPETRQPYNITNFQGIAEDFNIRVPQLDQFSPDLRSAFIALSSSDDPTQRQFAHILRQMAVENPAQAEAELKAAIAEETAAAAEARARQ